MKPAKEWLSIFKKENTVERYDTAEVWLELKDISESQIKRVQLDASNSHPDDEQPITEEWLMGVGFVGKTIKWNKDKIALIHHRGDWWMETNTEISITTRRQLRLLAELLGVTLNEQSK